MRRELIWFAVLVLLLASVFYVVGPVIGSLSAVTQSNVPAAALMFVCPAIAAFVVAGRSGVVRDLLSRLRPLRMRWYFWVGAVLVMPAALCWASILTGEYGFTVPSLLSVLALSLVYLVSGLGEEIGWTGFALPRLLRCHGEFLCAIILGAFWAAWHIIPFWEAGNSAQWIVGQCLFTIVLRLLLVRLTVLGGMSIWPAVVCHAAYNLAWSLSPDAGSHYNPWVVATVTACAVAFLYLIRRPVVDRTGTFDFGQARARTARRTSVVQTGGETAPRLETLFDASHGIAARSWRRRASCETDAARTAFGILPANL